MKAASMDMWKAHKQFAVHPAESPLNIIGFFDPTTGLSRFSISFVMIFGKMGQYHNGIAAQFSWRPWHATC
jgi:hypothetical protein